MKTNRFERTRREFDRRGFLRCAATMTAGGLAVAALLERPGAIASAGRPASLTATASVLTPAGARPGEPYFFRIETTAGRTAVGPAVKEV